MCSRHPIPCPLVESFPLCDHPPTLVPLTRAPTVNLATLGEDNVVSSPLSTEPRVSARVCPSTP